MTNGEKALVCCSIILVIFALLFLGTIGGCYYRNIKRAPEYSRPENVQAVYKDLITKVHTLISSGRTFSDIKQGFSDTNWPEEVLYVKIAEDKNEAKKRNAQAESAEILKRITWNGHSNYTINNYGHGHLHTPTGSVAIIIIDADHPNAKGVPINYTIYIAAPVE